MSSFETDRRSLFAGAAGLMLSGAVRTRSRELIKPQRPAPGDRVGLVNPATAAFDAEYIDVVKETLEAQGLEVVFAPNYFKRRGYLAGTDEERAADIMGFVHDESIKGMWARGGWGSARVLPHLDFDAIRANPKVYVGYSDSTALLSAIREKAGLVTFHGPFPQHEYTARHQRALLFDAQALTLSNPKELGSSQTVQTEDRIRVLRPGKATGPLVGGNLSIVASIVGTPYLPSFDGAILFLEDIDEAIYRVDRMLTQLALAGLLERVNGVVFGRCTDCPSGSSTGGLTLEDVLRDHFMPLRVPVFAGAKFGHIKAQWTLPVGVAAEMDAGAGTLKLLEPGVV